MDGAGLDCCRTEPAGIGEVAPRGHAAPVQGRQTGGESVRAAGIRVTGIRILGDRRRTCPRQGGELSLDAPVSCRDEGHALALALDDQPRGHRLHPAGGQTRADLAPQHGADLIADQAVQDAAGLLSVHQMNVQIPGAGQRPGDGLLRDLRERHPPHGHFGLENLEEVPGDGLALAVVICCQVELFSALEGLAELGDRLLLIGIDDVIGLEAVFDVDRELPVGALLLRGRQLGGLSQITDMADGGLDVELRAKVRGNRADLVGGLDDDKLGGHGCLPRVSSDDTAPHGGRSEMPEAAGRPPAGDCNASSGTSPGFVF